MPRTYTAKDASAQENLMPNAERPTEDAPKYGITANKDAADEDVTDAAAAQVKDAPEELRTDVYNTADAGARLLHKTVYGYEPEVGPNAVAAARARHAISLRHTHISFWCCSYWFFMSKPYP